MSAFEYSKAAEQVEQRVAAGMTREAATYLFQLALDAHTADSNLRASADRLANRMQRLVAAMDEGRSVNSLGEVQGAGSDLDRLCALREAAHQHLRRATAALEPVQ